MKKYLYVIIVGLFEEKIDYSKYPKVDLYVVLTIPSSYDLFYRPEINKDDIKLSTTKKDDYIEAVVKNDGELDVDNLTLQCVFYRNEKIVGYITSSLKYNEDLKAGESKEIEIAYPTDDDEKEIDFDKYEVKIKDFQSKMTY